MKRACVFAAIAAALVGQACAAPRAEGPAARAVPASAPAVVTPAAEPEDTDEPSEATLHDADRVIAGLRPGFRACYERGRREKGPRLSGKMILVTRVAGDGTVKSARVAEVDGLPPLVTECVARKMRGAKFQAPGGAARLEVPVHFVRQR